MWRSLLLVSIGLLMGGNAVAGWSDCEGGASPGTAIGPGKVICYDFSSTDLTMPLKDWKACDNVDWSFDDDGATHQLCIYVCTNSNTSSCAKLTVACLSGADGDASYEGAPGSLQYGKLENGAITTETPQARATCH